MKKIVIALRGRGNLGKSSSIKEAYNLLKQGFLINSITHEILGADIRAVLTIGNIKIGIESQGDPSSRLPASLKLFRELGCKIIICATRTKGATVDAVEALKHAAYEVTFLDKVGEQDDSKHITANLTTANLIVSHVQNALKT